MTMQRWVFSEPLDPDTTYTFERNPDKMASPTRSRELQTLATGAATADAGIRALKAPDQAFQWQFSGTLRSQEMYDALLLWSQKEYPITVTDDLDRTFTILPIGFEPEDAANARQPWRHRYTFKAYLFPDGAPNGSTQDITGVTYAARPTSQYVIGNPFPPPSSTPTPDPVFPPSGPPVPVEPDHDTDFGTSIGYSATWQINNFPNAKSVRHYDSTSTTIKLYSSGSAVGQIHTGCPGAVIWKSIKPADSSGNPDPSGVISGAWDSRITAWINSWTIDVVLGMWHEPAQGWPSPRVSPSDWKGMQLQFLSLVASAANPHVKTFGCLQGFDFLRSGGSVVDTYFKQSGVLLGFDYYGFDNYSQTESNDAMAWAQAEGVNWAINEWGVANSGTPVSDSATKTALIAAKAAWAAYPPAAFQYFDAANHGVDDCPNLIDAPLTNAYLKGLAGP